MEEFKETYADPFYKAMNDWAVTVPEDESEHRPRSWNEFQQYANGLARDEFPEMKRQFNQAPLEAAGLTWENTSRERGRR